MAEQHDRATLLADHVKSPATLATPRARHGRQVPCSTDLTAELLRLLGDADMPARDRRHEDCAAWPDIEAWLDHLTYSTKRPATIYVYERQTAPLLRANPDKTIGQFTSEDVIRALNLIPPRSRYITRSIYGQLFDWAIFSRRIEQTPMAYVGKLKAGHPKPTDIFTETEIAMLEACPIPDGPLFTILFFTGLRRGEARRLKRQHIDLARMRLMVYDGKGGKDRPIPFGPEVAAAVANLDLVERLEPADHLWYRRRYTAGDRRRRQDPIGDTTFETWWRDMLDQAGVRYLNPHQARHTYAWFIRQAGLDLEERQALMGHENPATTIRQYGRIDFEQLAAKVAAL